VIADTFGMRVRQAQPADASAVAAVHVRSWQVAYRGLLPDQYLDALEPESRARHYRFGDLDPSRPSTIVALEAGVICGFAITGPCGDDGDTGELLALYVDPDRWGRGIGRALLRESRARLIQRNFAHAVLWVLAGNKRAERFYRVDGWGPNGRRRQETVWGLTVDEIGYSRPLP
jgi:ribosomal protein S18 acetylase RimI-like enzyme